MKQLIFILTLLFALPAISQNSALFTQLTDEYSDKDGFSASMLTSDMFDLYLKKKNLDDSSPVYAALNNLESIVVVSQGKIKSKVYSTGTSETEPSENNQIHKTILDYYKKNNFTLFKTEKRMGEDVKVYVDKKQDKIASLALVTNSNSSTNLVELQGDIDLNTVSELSAALNLRGLENLYKLNNSSSYYGPAFRASQEDLEIMIAKQREHFIKQKHLSEEQRAEIELQAKELAEKQMQMAEKYREMEERYRRQPIFLSHPGDTNTVFYIDGKKVEASEMKSLLPDNIESIEVNKAKKENEKTSIRIKTK